MNWVKTINDAIEYMEGHLTDEITLADIAKHVNLSAFHFQRAFSLLTDMTPAEYLRKRRLSRAGADLAGGEEKVIDVAMKYCYDSPESFTKAFTRFHGISPMQVKKGSPIQFMNKRFMPRQAKTRYRSSGMSTTPMKQPGRFRDISDFVPSRRRTVMSSGTASAAKLPMWKASRKGSRSSIFRNIHGRFSNASDRHPRQSRPCGKRSTRNGCRFPIMN